MPPAATNVIKAAAARDLLVAGTLATIGSGLYYVFGYNATRKMNHEIQTYK
eukprot:m.134559 g.134559  ORF g.134559 m.134559 type:complete len:51 (+) comp16916_c0_seq2:2239-2391(+)